MFKSYQNILIKFFDFDTNVPQFQKKACGKNIHHQFFSSFLAILEPFPDQFQVILRPLQGD